MGIFTVQRFDHVLITHQAAKKKKKEKERILAEVHMVRAVKEAVTNDYFHYSLFWLIIYSVISKKWWKRKGVMTEICSYYLSLVFFQGELLGELLKALRTGMSFSIGQLCWPQKLEAWGWFVFFCYVHTYLHTVYLYVSFSTGMMTLWSCPLSKIRRRRRT